MDTISKYKACLLGGAIGDALGYAVEFYNEDTIFSEYGQNGITKYELAGGTAVFSDDTQMTLFTANGLLSAYYNKNSYIDSIYTSYKEWFITQSCTYEVKQKCGFASWIMDVPELWHRRAPGFTCLNAVSSGQKGSVKNPLNDSKGCGGIMRVAPVGLFFKNTDRISHTDMLAAEVSAITHGHELGYIPSACFAHIINLISHDEKITLKNAVLDSISHTEKFFKNYKHIDYFTKLMNKAVRLSEKKCSDLDSIHELGEGWVAEETLAIAVYCALKYENDFEKAIVTSVNHNGDSDSTGAVTGNIMGAYLGMDAIPRKFLDNLEIRDVISEIAEDLYNYDVEERTGKKYIK